MSTDRFLDELDAHLNMRGETVPSSGSSNVDAAEGVLRDADAAVVGFPCSVGALLGEVRDFFRRYVVVTDGREGAFVGTPQAILYCPVLETKVAGTAGAGDAFNATFTACMALGRPAEEALRAAAINSASVVNHVDTQTGLLSLQDIDRRLGETKAALEVRKWSH